MYIYIYIYIYIYLCVVCVFYCFWNLRESTAITHGSTEEELGDCTKKALLSSAVNA